MANAAAKKAATARSQAAATYFPIVMGINAVYVLLCLGSQGYEHYLSFWNLAGVVLTWGLQYFAYVGILDNAANRNPNDKSLVGGSSLDLLGLTVVVQFGTVLWSPRLYWVLAGVPIWGGWTLYSTFAGNSGAGGSSKTNAAQKEPTEEDEALAARRQKRSERRRQKRT